MARIRDISALKDLDRPVGIDDRYDDLSEVCSSCKHPPARFPSESCPTKHLIYDDTPKWWIDGDAQIRGVLGSVRADDYNPVSYRSHLVKNVCIGQPREDIHDQERWK